MAGARVDNISGGIYRISLWDPAAGLTFNQFLIDDAGFGYRERTRGFMDGDTLELGEHKLRFMETPHVHHWDSMMVLEETTNSL